MNPELAQAILASAGRLGADPLDLATAISFESAGTFSPDIMGGAGGRHQGLIQFGPEERATYGVKPGMSAPEQMTAVEAYLRDRGFKPGMGMLDLYSTINAGRPGRYNASDTAAGGTPGTVRDKVLEQMAPHRTKAQQLLAMVNPELAARGAPAGAPLAIAPAPMGSPMGVDAAAAEASAAIDPSILQALRGIASRGSEEEKGFTIADIEFGTPPGMQRQRAKIASQRRKG